MMARKLRKIDQVIEAALHEFQEYGYLGANVNRIRERAQVSKRTLYNYFSGKQAMFEEIVSRAANMRPEDHKFEFSATNDVAAQLSDLACKMAEPCTDIRFVLMARLVLSERIRNADFVDTLLANVAQQKFVVRFFVSARNANAIDREEATLIAADISAYVNAMCLWPSLVTGKTMEHSAIKEAADRAGVIFASRFRKP